MLKQRLRSKIDAAFRAATDPVDLGFAKADLLRELAGDAATAGESADFSQIKALVEERFARRFAELNGQSLEPELEEAPASAPAVAKEFPPDAPLQETPPADCEAAAEDGATASAIGVEAKAVDDSEPPVEDGLGSEKAAAAGDEPFFAGESEHYAPDAAADHGATPSEAGARGPAEQAGASAPPDENPPAAGGEPAFAEQTENTKPEATEIPGATPAGFPEALEKDADASARVIPQSSGESDLSVEKPEVGGTGVSFASDAVRAQEPVTTHDAASVVENVLPPPDQPAAEAKAFDSKNDSEQLFAEAASGPPPVVETANAPASAAPEKNFASDLPPAASAEQPAIEKTAKIGSATKKQGEPSTIDRSKKPGEASAPPAPDLPELEVEIAAALSAARSVEQLGVVKNTLQRAMTAQIVARLKAAPPAAKRELGQQANAVKELIERHFTAHRDRLEAAALAERIAQERIDVHLPGNVFDVPRAHVLNAVADDLADFLKGLGFDIVQGPEAVSPDLNFTALNIPENHPARAAADSLFLEGGQMLRTHCTTVTASVLAKRQDLAELRVAAYGNVYRKDDDDATHSHQFMQMDLFWVGKDISVANLKWLLQAMCVHLFGAATKIRLRPSHFPFTEPSFEVDVSCHFCAGKGCPLCKQSGWIEVLGSGMLHPNVLKSAGHDPDRVQGFAAGIGIDRLAMIKYQVKDIRAFYGNDLRFLKGQKGTW